MGCAQSSPGESPTTAKGGKNNTASASAAKEAKAVEQQIAKLDTVVTEQAKQADKLASLAGEKLGETAVDSGNATKQDLEKKADSIDEYAKSLDANAAAGLQAVQKKAQGAAKTAEGNAETETDFVSAAVIQAQAALSDASKQAQSTLVDAAKQAETALSSASEQAKVAVTDAANQAGATLSGASKQAENTANETAKQAEAKLSDASKRAEVAANETAKQAEATAKQAEAKISDASKRAEVAANETAKQAEVTAKQAEATLSDASKQTTASLSTASKKAGAAAHETAKQADATLSGVKQSDSVAAAKQASEKVGAAGVAAGAAATDAAKQVTSKVQAAAVDTNGSTVPHVVIVGAGFYGITAAKELSKLADEGLATVTLIDSAEKFVIGATLQYYLTKRISQPEQNEFSYDGLAISNKISKLLGTSIETLDTSAKTLTTTDGTAIKYDHCILAPGVVYYPEKIPGLADNMLNFCYSDDVVKLRSQLDEINNGTVLLCVSALPYKCPPAPFEYVFLIDEILRKRGVREKVNLKMTWPTKPFPFGNDKVAKIFLGVCEEKGIEVTAAIAPTAVAKNKDGLLEVKYENDTTIACNLLVGTYPQGAPKFLQKYSNPKGFVPVDIITQETKMESVYCTGDASWMMLASEPPKPHPKAGGFSDTAGVNAGRMVDCVVRGDSLEDARKKLIMTRQATCFAECGMGKGILVGPKLLADEKGPMGFATTPPNAMWYDKKRTWMMEYLDKFLGEGTGDKWNATLIKDA